MSNLLKTTALTFSSSALTGSFQNVGSALTAPAIMLQFMNPSSVAVIFTDGTSTWQIPPTTSSPVFGESEYEGTFQGPRYQSPTGAQFQVKQTTGAGAGTNDLVIHVIQSR